jgi:hypothetical protein
VTATATSFPLSKHTGGRWHCTSFLRPGCLFTVHLGSGSFPPPVEYSSHRGFYELSCSWLLGMCRRSCLLQLACCEGLPLPLLWCSGHSAFFAMCLLCCYCLLFSFFLFFPCAWVGLSRGLCWSGPGWSVGVLHAVQLTLWSASSQAIWVLSSGSSTGALLVFPFNVKWECCMWAGGVEQSNFCFFSVVFPVRCISSVSPRFYFRRHAFCFLSLAAILFKAFIMKVC